MKKVPLVLLTGFLGSGKSTFINRVLKEYADLKIGLIVNEFGDVNLESQIITKTDEDIVELSNGCMCCVVRSDLIATVEKLLTKNPELDMIIAEASGLSDPVPIAQTFLMNDVSGKVRLDAIFCIVDTLNFEKNSKEFYITLTQLRYADFVLLSKTDLASPEQVAKVREAIVALVPDVRIIDLHQEKDLDILIDTDKNDHSEIAELEEDHDHEAHKHEHHCEHCGSDHCTHEHTHDHHEHEHHKHDHAHEHVDTLFFKTERPLDFEKFSELLQRLPEEIIRAKGFVHFSREDLTETKYLLQYVGARKQLVPAPWKIGEVRQSALVFIGKHFDISAVEKDLKDCEVH